MNENELVIKLTELRNLPKETEWMEFKESNYKPQEIGEYISALSNSACLHNKDKSYLIFGIKDSNHEITGTSFKPKFKKVGNQELENWLAIQLKPAIDFVIYEFQIDKRNIVLFEIDPTYNTPVEFRGEAYIRVGTYKKKLNDHPEKARKIWTKVPKIPFEKQIAMSSVTADDVINLLDYPGYFELIKINLPDNKSGIINKLLQEQLIVINKSKYNITNLGALLFGKDIEAFETISRKAVRVIIYDGKNRIKAKKEQSGKKGYAVGFERMIKYLDDQLPTHEEIGLAFRKERKIYPSIALRELVANAIIHQDFSEDGTSTMVEIFENRIEITNPGKPLIDTLRFIDHSPISRNELLAKFMRRINLCEERGSGIDKVIFECEFSLLPAPDFIVGPNYTRVILYGPKTLRQMDKNDKIRACYQHSCLKYVSGDQMTNQTLRERFDIEKKNYSIVSRIIRDTLKSTLIKEYDPENKSRKQAKYLPFWA